MFEQKVWTRLRSRGCCQEGVPPDMAGARVMSVESLRITASLFRLIAWARPGLSGLNTLQFSVL